jgi:hypothetical protein
MVAAVVVAVVVVVGAGAREARALLKRLEGLKRHLPMRLLVLGSQGGGQGRGRAAGGGGQVGEEPRGQGGVRPPRWHPPTWALAR